MSKSVKRVEEAAAAAGLDTEIKRMGASTRTAEEAAAQCGCAVDQIVKSLIFEGKETGELFLFLVPGSKKLDLTRAAALCEEALVRADPRKVREKTGFAIGGVSPIGHKSPIRCIADRTLLAYEQVWAAAGAPDAVFSSNPADLLRAAQAEVADLTEIPA
ncbi:YbaK/EbsC family protein [Nitratireductor sp. CH_MIT9313-5]|uniref:YbaK/EbsC family protein n=1 Tax=Nitratireductor sp. CH_MIT9313-5 TaxID=3107764 RepID=UPI003008B6AD